MTWGRDIYFAPGKYDPTTKEGLALIAHELVHVQQYGKHGKLGFAERYLGEYFLLRRRGYGHTAAVRGISFEVIAELMEIRVWKALHRAGLP